MPVRELINWESNQTHPTILASHSRATGAGDERIKNTRVTNAPAMKNKTQTMAPTEE